MKFNESLLYELMSEDERNEYQNAIDNYRFVKVMRNDHVLYDCVLDRFDPELYLNDEGDYSDQYVVEYYNK